MKANANKSLNKFKLMFLLKKMEFILLVFLIVLSFIDKSTRIFAGLGVYFVIAIKYLNVKLSEYKKQNKLKAYLSNYFIASVIGFIVLVLIFAGVPLIRTGCNINADKVIVGFITMLCVLVLVLFVVGIIKEIRGNKNKSR